uniref:Uncharacterized protein LOC116940451 n=1 Tax=Petromyzon marinus TaxID=7757 RepID=A0AAJ7SV38_PETMA|nr:uncharacterized protein LOC116940451 [Petromyzon marinus]XP_032806187.1 uncharacterized protein LOC116940451 [Petromyzon marinus]XP_032806188.1 uncharacterized protein LOC116940451 [Petromyzon marinus]XP_032806189.1 uncharacterized protein LOC116940451 [Petromyzon marinus]XP_032806190.1 uncharacterized protein LOC116940451 [Petromyzon marinus]XP_032806191.1 uncharacterized protein LOC116940451 [Petromyzon marinus]
MASGLEVPGHLYGGEEEEDEDRKEGSDRQDAVGRTRPTPRGGSEQTSSTSDTFASNTSGLSLGETIARSACQRSEVWFPLEMEADTSNGEEKTIAERDSFLTSDQAVAMSQGSWPPHPVSSAQLEVQDSLLSPVLSLLVTALDGDGAVGSALMQRSVQQQHSELEFTCLRESIASTDFTFEGYSTNREVEKMSLSDSPSVKAVKELRSPESARLPTFQHPSAVSQCLPSAHELQASLSAYGEADSSVFCSLTQHAISPGTDSMEWSPRGHLSEHTKLPVSGSSMHAELSLSQHPIVGASFDDRQPDEDTERLPGLPEEPSQESEWREEESQSSSRGIAGPSRAPMDDKPSSSASEESRGGMQNEAGMQRERYLQATRFAYLGQEEPPADDTLLSLSCVGAELSKAGVDDTGCRFASTQVGSTSEAGSLTRNVVGGNADGDTDSPSLMGTMASVVLTEEDKRQISAIKHLVLRGASVPVQSYVPEGNSESFPQVNSSDCDTNRHWGQIYDRSDVMKHSPRDGSRASLRYKTMALAASFSKTTCVTDSWLEGSLLIAGGDPNESRREERSERSVPSGAEPDNGNIDGADAGAIEASGNNRSSPVTRGSFALALSTAGAFSLGQLGDISAEQDMDALFSARSCGPSQTGNQTPALSTARSQASLEVDNYTPPWTSTGYGTGNQEFDIEQRIPVYLRNLGIEQPPSMTGMLDGRGPLCERDYSPSELTTVKDFGLSSASDGAVSNGADGSLGRGSGYSLRSELGQSTSLVLDSDSSLRLSSSLTRSQARATNEDSEAAPGESLEGSGNSRSYLMLLNDVDNGHSQQEGEQSVRVRAPASSEREADTVLSMEDLDNRRGDLSSTPSRLQDCVYEVGSIGLAGYSGPAKSSEFEKPSYQAHAGYFYEDKGSNAQGETWPGSQSTEPAQSQVSDSMIETKTALGIQKLLRDAGTYDHSTFDASCESNEQDILKSLRTDGRTGPSNSHELQPEGDRTVFLDGKAEFDKTSTFTGKIPSTEQHYQSSYFPLGQDDHGSVEHPRPGVAKGAAKARDVSSPFVQPKLDLHSAGKSEQDVERQTIPGSARHEPEGCSGATTSITPRPQRAPWNPSHDDKSSSSGRSSRADDEPQARPLQSGTDAPRSGYGNEGGDDDDVMARVRAILRGATEHADPQEDSDGSVDAGSTERRRQGAGGLPRSASPSVGTAPPPSQIHEDTGLPSRQGRATEGDTSVGFGQPLPPPPSQIHADIAPGRLRSEADAVSMESVVQRLAVLLSDKSPDDLSEGIYKRSDEEEQRAKELPTKLKLERDGADPAWRSSHGEPSSMQRGDLRSLVTTVHGLHEQSETDSESESVTLTRVSHILSEASGSQRLASLDLSVIEPEPLNVLQRARLRIASQLQRLSDEPFDSSVGLARVAPGQQQQPALPDPPRQPVPGEQLPSQKWSRSSVPDGTGVRGDISGGQPPREEQSPSRLPEKSAAGRRADQSRRGSCRLPDRLPEDRGRASERSVGLTDGERSASYEAWVTDRRFRAATLGSVPDLHRGTNEISDSGHSNDKVFRAELIDVMGMAGEKTPPEGHEYRRPISSITFTSRKRGDSSPSTRSPSPSTVIAAQTQVSVVSPENQPSSGASLVHTPVHYEQPAGLRAEPGVEYLMVANTAPSKDLQIPVPFSGEDKSGYSDHGPTRLSARSALTHMHIKLSPAKAGHSLPPTATPLSSLPTSSTVIFTGNNNDNGSDSHLGGVIAQAARGRASPSGFRGSEAPTLQLRATAGQEDTRSLQHACPAVQPSISTHEGSHPPVTHGQGNPLSFSFTFVSSASAQGTADQPLVCPYRPAGSSELFYIPAVVGNTGKSSPCSSHSTAESSHPGSNNALPPTFPAGVLGSRDRHMELRQVVGGPSSTSAGPSRVSWQPPPQGGSVSRTTAQHNIHYPPELNGWTSVGSAERGPPIDIRHLDGAQRARGAWMDSGLTPDARSAWGGRERSRSAAPTVNPVAYERTGRAERRVWQESSGKFTEPHAQRRQHRSTGVESTSPGASGGTRGTTEPSLDELWGRFTIRQEQLRALDGADEGALLQKLEELARHLRRSQSVGKGARLTPTGGMWVGMDTVSSTQPSIRLDETGDRRQRSLDLEDTWSGDSRGGGGRLTPPPSSLAASSISTDPDGRHDDASSVAETASTIDTARLVRAFGPGRVRLSSPALRSLHDAVHRQREGPGKVVEVATRGRRSGAAERGSRAHTLSSSGAATDSPSERSHAAPPPPVKSRGRQRSKGVQAGDLELVPGANRRTRDVGVTFPSPALVAAAAAAATAAPPRESTRGSPVRASGKDGAATVPSAQQNRHDKRSRAPRRRQRPIHKPVSWFVPLDRRVDQDSDVSRQGAKENVSVHAGDQYERSSAWHGPGWDSPEQSGSGAAVGVGSVLRSRPPLREMQQHDLEEELAGGTLRSLERLTLQEALHMNRPAFVYRSRERIKRLQLMSEERRVQGVWQEERERLFGWGTRGRRRRHGQGQSSSVRTHPIFDNLFLARKRVVPKKEAFVRSKSLYEKLPEIRRRREVEKKLAEYQSNRLKADNFQRRVTNKLLGRSTAWE